MMLKYIFVAPIYEEILTQKCGKSNGRIKILQDVKFFDKINMTR
jgi:hypothetical protein